MCTVYCLYSVTSLFTAVAASSSRPNTTPAPPASSSTSSGPRPTGFRPSNSGESAASAAPSRPAAHPPALINRLMTQVANATRDQVIEELTKAGGNEELALMNLLARSINFPKKS